MEDKKEDTETKRLIPEKLEEDSENYNLKSQKKKTKQKLIIILFIIFISLGMIIIVIIFIIILVAIYEHEMKIPSDPLARAKYLAREVPLIDGHNDLPETIFGIWNEKIPIVIHLNRRLTEEEIEILKSYGRKLMTDIPRMRDGYLGGQFWVVFKNCKINGSEAVEGALTGFSTIHQMIDVYNRDLIKVSRSSEIMSSFSTKKILSLIGVEGGQMINSNLQVLHEFYTLGARYLTLTHNCNTAWADSCCDPSGKFPHNGLTNFGKEVILEMNKLGMMVDLSHASNKTMKDAIETSKAPVIFSHANAYTLCNNRRNVPDDVVDMIKENNGIIMVTFVPSFLKESVRKFEEFLFNQQFTKEEMEIRIKQRNLNNPNEVNIGTIVDHIDYIKNRIGVNHVGIDFDGFSTTPLGMEDVSKFIYLIEELVKRGYSDGEVKKILSENIIRVMKSVENVAMQMKNDTIFHT